MAADFCKRWIVDRAAVRKARVEDLQYVDDPEYLGYLAIYFANIITKLGKKLGLRQRVIATATVFFRRFYLKNSYCETDPFIVIAACCYVAAKAEESPVHIKTVISEARTLFGQDMYNVKNFPTDNSKLAEMEFYLVDDLECDLTVFHPYRTLLTLCKKEANEDVTSESANDDAEAGEVGANAGVGIGGDDGQRYWGSGEGRLELSAGALQTAWFIINDTYRSDICLLYPPHLIAIAAIYLTFILHAPTRATLTPLLPSSPSSSTPSTPSQQQPTEDPTHSPTPTPKPRRSTRNTHTPQASLPLEAKKSTPQDPITFLSELNISLPLVATLSQEIISLYTLWERYKEDAHPEAKLSNTNSTSSSGSALTPAPTTNSTGVITSPYTSPLKPPSRSASMSTTAASALGIGTPTNTADVKDEDTGDSGGVYVTPAFLSALVTRMREAKLMDANAVYGVGIGVGGSLGVGLANNGGLQRQVAVNKMLERTQAAG